MKTIKITMAQAVVKYLMAQKIIIDGKVEPLIPGVYGIFGHGNVTCLGHALENVKEEFPTWRGQNEQSMALAGIAYAKSMQRRQIMAVTTSIGPGATNVVTAAGVAHANRLPLLIIAGDTFVNRIPDPVLQQVEHFGSPSTTVNDTFKPVSRYWDRITSPLQIISSLPQAIATMLDPADCGPAFIALPQDIQAIAYEYPVSFFDECVHEIPRARADEGQLERAISAIKKAKKPLIIAGGGVIYSGAAKALSTFAQQYNIPVCETVAGRSAFAHQDPAYIGPIGVMGADSVNALAGEADVVIAIGTRLQDFTTGSWSIFSQDCQFVSINAGRYDSVKHRAVSVVGDALVCINDITALLTDWAADAQWAEKGREAHRSWDNMIEEYTNNPGDILPSYSHVIGAVNRHCDEDDKIISAAGGLPSELAKSWRTKKPGTFDCEFGFSCMGYEIAGGWGAAKLTKGKTNDTIVFTGDGSYLIMNSDIYSSVLDGNKMIIVVCDNGGFAVINRLQISQGGESYNNLIKDSTIEKPFSVDFVQHAQSMGAHAEKVTTITEFEQAFIRAKAADKTYVIQIDTNPFDWLPGVAFWDVAVPEVTSSEKVRLAAAAHNEKKKRQRIGV
jgi:3D-(3,5/4)-trihydroxycyclohexane-1,2-dione acylhydrolase (decyclizing)